ncbi:MAG: hypothetical protein ACTSUX_06535 [Promethearchaeota archaeon]
MFIKNYTKNVIYFILYLIISATISILLIILYFIFYINGFYLKFLEFLIPIVISVFITLTSPIYQFLLKRSKLKFELDNGRDFLIKVFNVSSDSPNPLAKYLRVKLVNVGRITAINCSVKIYIYNSNGELVREPSNLYPSGYHNYKQEGKNPPLINIAAGDFQIFDICSSKYNANPYFIRFEDHFTYSRHEAEINPLSLHNYLFITLFAYSDNNLPIKKNFKIYRDSNLSNEFWEQIDIKECDWRREIKKTSIKEEKQNLKKNHQFINSNLNSKVLGNHTYSTGNIGSNTKDSSKYYYSTGNIDKEN